jgi:hypothetical protein
MSETHPDPNPVPDENEPDSPYTEPEPGGDPVPDEGDDGDSGGAGNADDEGGDA